MLNWPYVYPSAKAEVPDIFKNMGSPAIPAIDSSEPSHVTLGGINLGVGDVLQAPGQAMDATKCLRSQENQLIAAAEGRPAADARGGIRGPEVDQGRYPDFAELMKETVNDGVPRPVSPAYSDVSLAIQRTCTRRPASSRSRRSRRWPTRSRSWPKEGCTDGRRPRSRPPPSRPRPARRDLTGRARGRRKLGWLLCAPAVIVDAARHRLPDRLRVLPLAAALRPALPRRPRVRRARQLHHGADVEHVVEDFCQHDDHHRRLGGDRARARHDASRSSCTARSSAAGRSARRS